MALTPFEIPRFGGLNLTADPEEVSVGAAVDCMNVSLQADGRLATRAGYASWATGINSVVVMRQITTSGNVAVGSNGSFKIFNSVGTLVANDGAAPPTQMGDLATLATAGTTRTYEVATASSMRYWDGSVFSAGASQNGQRLCVTPWDFRLALTGYSATASTVDRIIFSDPGNGSTFVSTNFVDLNPGDGETIVAAVAWCNNMFVFKQNRFFVFYGTSVDGSGNPIFNYTTVAGVGAVDPGQNSPTPKSHVVAAGREGVYFLASDGVYVTTGGTPQRISKPLDAWFRGDTLPNTSIPANIGLSNSVLGVVGNYVYVCPNNSQSLTFVYDITTGAWTAYDWAFTAICSLQIGAGIPTPLLAIGSTIYKHSPASTTDAGVAISSRYRTGFWNPGLPGTESVVREWLVDGSGTPTFKTAVNDTATLGTGATVTLGTAPAVAQGRDRRSVRGRNISFELSGTSAWSVSRVVANLRGQSWPGKKAT